ncbi:MAG: TusE/DsrC/DsvC family sulfur relay protein, partial [Gammaproteobacteria bacterium]|nr:TusE/DsrC/DsvC family sulfur relay protein [Gammaproteobacteria bacterium]
MNVNVNNKIIKTDEEGYLLNLDDWTDDVAEEMSALQAEKDHVKLTETHWGLIHYFRDYYEIY